MTSDLAALLVIEQQKRFRFQSILGEKNQRKKVRMIVLAISILLLVVAMAGYCFALAYGLGYLNLSKVIPGYALTISGIVTLFFTFLKTNGVLFAAKDYEFLMALPIPTKTIVTSKFMSMYLNNLLFCMLVMIPMAVGYSFWNSVSGMFVIMWLFGILLAPLFPMTIAAFIGMCIISFGAKFKRKALVEILCSALLLVGIFGGSFWLQKSSLNNQEVLLATLSNAGTVVSQMIHKIYPLSAFFDEGVNNGKVVPFIAFAAISILVFVLFVEICGRIYRKIHTKLQSHQTHSNYKLGELKSSPLLLALAKKEAKRFFSSSLYMLNMGIGLIMALLAAGASLFIGVDRVIDGMDISNIDAIKPVISVIIPFVIAMIVNMCNTTAVSLSLEGKNLWIVQSLPISNAILIKGKMLFNVMLVLPVSLICSIVFAFALKVSVGYVCLYLLFSVASVCFSTALGAWINLHFPNYEWENEVEVIKQGMGSMIGIFSGMLLYLVLAFAAFFLSSKIPEEIIILLATLILLLMGLVIYRRATGFKSLQRKK